MFDFLQRNSGPRVIWGGDINQSMTALKNATLRHSNLEPWEPVQPGNGLHGDIVLKRGVSVDLLHCRIGKDQSDVKSASDAHVMVGIVLHTEFDSAAKPVNTVPERVVRPILLPRRVAEMERASSGSVPERDARGKSDVTPTVTMIETVLKRRKANILRSIQVLYLLSSLSL